LMEMILPLLSLLPCASFLQANKQPAVMLQVCSRVAARLKSATGSSDSHDSQHEELQAPYAAPCSTTLAPSACAPVPAAVLFQSC
jgi:hypothetical protein